MKALYTVGLLIFSNIFMTIAWYGHLKFKDLNWFAAFFRNEHFRLNHFIGFVFLILAVYFIFKK